MPGSGRVTVTCRGRGCRRGSLSSSRRDLKRLWQRLVRSVYRPGDTLRIVISARSWASERAEVDIHDSAKPTAKLIRH